MLTGWLVLSSLHFSYYCMMSLTDGLDRMSLWGAPWQTEKKKNIVLQSRGPWFGLLLYCLWVFSELLKVPWLSWSLYFSFAKWKWNIWYTGLLCILKWKCKIPTYLLILSFVPPSVAYKYHFPVKLHYIHYIHLCTAFSLLLQYYNHLEDKEITLAIVKSSIILGT